MIIEGLNANDLKILSGLADALMWAGHDRAADAIYAAVEADEADRIAVVAGEWADVFNA